MDFTAYWRLERPITEATYEADEFGPVPVQELLLTRDLEAAGRFEWVLDWDRRWLPCISDEPDMSIFEPVERELIDGVIDQFRQHQRPADGRRGAHVPRLDSGLAQRGRPRCPGDV
jgi:hypothetical protein